MAQNEESGIRDDALRIEITADASPPVEAEFSIPGQSGSEEEFVLPTTDKDKGNKFSAETQAAYEGLVAADKGVDPIQTYNELQGLPSEALTEQARQKYLDDLDVGIQQVLEAQLATQPPDGFAQDLEDATDFDASARQKAGSSTIPERRAVENISRLTGPEADEIEKKIINQMHFRRRIGEILHNQGYVDWAENLAGVLLLSDESLDTGRTAAGGIGRIDPEVLGAWLNSAGNWQKFVTGFAQLSADEQREDFESIVETLRDTTDENAIKMAIHLLDLVDPTGADKSQAWHALDKLGLVGTVAGIAGRIARIFKAADLAKVAEQLDNVDLAATTVRVASVDAKAADAVGTTRFEAAEKVMPFDNSALLGGAPSDVAAKVVEQQNLITEYTKIADAVGGKFITQAEAELQAATALDRLEKVPNVRNVRVSSVTEDGFTITYDVGNARQTFTKNFTVDDINGIFVDEDMGIIKSGIRGVLSPNALFQKNRTLLVNEPERLLRESAMAARKFKEATLQIFKGMSKESVQKVNAVVARGRDNGKVYSYGELVGNDILTKQEFEAYALSRHLFDIAFKYEDKMVRNRLMAKGVKEVEINDLKELLRPAGDIDSAKAMLRGASGRTVYIPDAVAGDLKYTELTTDILEKYYAQGYTLARADAGQYIATGAGKYADFALVKKTRVRDLPPSVLHFNPGYAPISYKNGVYFVKSSIRGLVGNESKIVGLRTHRYFDSLKDANAFAEELRVAGYKDPTTGGQVIPKAEDVQVMHDRQMAQEAFEDDRIRIQGGLYTGARKGERLKFGLEGRDAELVDPLIALTTNLDHLARNYPAHLFRMKLEQTWMNTARARWGLPHTFKGTFKDAIKHISDGLSTTERAFAEKSHMQTLLQMNIPTTKERALRTWTRDFAERVEVGRSAPGLRRSAARLLHKVDNTDPVSIVTGAGFNLVLGMWNFSTMVVQGLGSTIPMAIHPLRAPLHLSSAMALGTMDKLADPNALKLARGRIGSRFKDMFPNEGYINDLHKSWSMSGLRETVLAGNPEYAALRTNLPYNPTLLGKFMNTHTIFYEVGEGFNFRYAWGAAFDWWKGQKGNSARKIDQSAVDEIRRRADTYMLHMNRANKSTIQTGAWRIPSQFTQIFFRFGEAVAGKELTMAEKARMLVGQSVLFGVAGVPLGTKVVDYTIERFGLNPSEETKDAVRSGAIQHFVQSYLGIDVDIAGRASIMKGFYDETMNIILGEESPGEVAFGATGGIVGLRSADAVSRIYNLGKTATAVPDSEDIPPAIYSAVLDSLLDMTSSWSNYTKAREVMVNKVFRDRNGGLLIRVGEDGAELNVQTKIAMALGLRYDQLNDIYIANMDNLKDRKRVTEKAASIVKTIDAILNESTTGESTEEQKRIVNLVVHAIMENETEDMRDRIRAAALDKLINPKSAADRVRRQQLETLINGGILGLTPSLLGDIPNGN